MYLDRRTLLKAGAAVTLTAGMPRFASASGFNPQPGNWRNFEVVTRLEIAKPEGKTQAWVPVPSVNEGEWFKSLGSTFATNGNAALKRDAKYGAEFIHVEWKDGETNCAVTVTSKISARDRAVDFTRTGGATLTAAQIKHYTEGTDLIPVDGIVKQTSDRIVAGAKTDAEKARAIYDWVVENTQRNAKTRGCGIGDIASMLKTGNLTGKCADLNALYVGLARSQGLPARDVYGLRIAPSKFGYKSLGAGSEVVTKAQHCRAEVHLAGIGWVPVDPADVRKVALEEPPANLSLSDPKVADARKALFGQWEGNWLAYNFAHDVTLPGATGPKLEFLMYPQAECGPHRLDCLDPDTFKYSIIAKEQTAA